MFVSHGAARPRPADLLIGRLAALAELSDSEVRHVRAAAASIETTRAGRNLSSDRRAPRQARFLVSGWACRRRVLADGRRQIFGFLVPGDLLDAGGAGSADVGYSALTAVEMVDAEPLVEAARDHFGFAAALAALADEQERRLLDHVVRLGRMTALERLCHLLLELRERLAATGLADDRRMPLPLTQEILADALGLSIVHVNRTLQQLRQGRMIELRSGVAHLLDPERMAELCGYREFAAPGLAASRRPAPANGLSPLA